MTFRIGISTTALVIAGVLITGCTAPSVAPAETGGVESSGAASAGAANSPSASARSDAPSAESGAADSESGAALAANITASPADALACGHVLEVMGTAWRSEFRLTNGDLDEAGYAAVELVLRDSWATLLTGDPHSDISAAVTTVSELARKGADLHSDEFTSAAQQVSEACDAEGITQTFRALPGMGG